MPQGIGYASNMSSFYPFMQGLEGGTPPASPSLFSVGSPGGSNWFDTMLGGAATSSSSSSPAGQMEGMKSMTQAPAMFDLQALIAEMGSFSPPSGKGGKKRTKDTPLFGSIGR